MMAAKETVRITLRKRTAIWAVLAGIFVVALMVVIMLVSPGFSWWALIPVVIVAAFFIIGAGREILFPLVIEFTPQEIIVRRGSRSANLPTTLVRAVGLTGAPRIGHLSAWIPAENAPDVADLIKLTRTQLHAPEGQWVVVPLTRSDQITEGQISQLQEHIVWASSYDWRSL
ncbi:hypothetical protein ACQEU3_20725 [Spirillospora sp. CA-253888]